MSQLSPKKLLATNPELGLGLSWQASLRNKNHWSPIRVELRPLPCSTLDSSEPPPSLPGLQTEQLLVYKTQTWLLPWTWLPVRNISTFQALCLHCDILWSCSIRDFASHYKALHLRSSCCNVHGSNGINTGKFSIHLHLICIPIECSMFHDVCMFKKIIMYLMLSVSEPCQWKTAIQNKLIIYY